MGMFKNNFDTSAYHFRAPGKISGDSEKMSKDPEVTVHCYIIYISLTILHAHVLRIIR